VLLMRAEALIEAGRQAEAYPLINQVRARVGMPTVENAEGAGLSQDQMRTVVRHERRIELAFEGLRFFDLKRWGDIPGAYQRSIDDKVAGYNPAYRNRKSEVFPIPQKEVDVNKNLVQNPAWQ
jgi:starch-binding outer membrane protein, SusD/RagB family